MESKLNHHKRYQYCRSRLSYRESKNPTAVKVYSVVNESKHLLVFGVPKINLMMEIKKEFKKFGDLESFILVRDKVASLGKKEEDFQLEQFTDCYHGVFKKLEHSRKCKKFLDARNFYGGILHISYAPEFETVNDIRQKFSQRISEVKFRSRINKRKMDTKK